MAGTNKSLVLHMKNLHELKVIVDCCLYKALDNVHNNSSAFYLFITRYNQCPPRKMEKEIKKDNVNNCKIFRAIFKKRNSTSIV